MQNLNKKASILIWAVMLSLIVSMSFISISSKINKNIKLSWEISKYNNEKTKLSSAIDNTQNTQLSNKKIVVFESNMKKIFALKQSEQIALSFSGSTNFNIDLWIVDWSWWWVYYNYINNNVSTHSWILNYAHSFSWELDSTNNSGTLILENLWWYSQILIKSEIAFVSPEKKYKIVQTIGNNNFIQTRNYITQ